MKKILSKYIALVLAAVLLSVLLPTALGSCSRGVAETDGELPVIYLFDREMNVSVDKMKHINVFGGISRKAAFDAVVKFNENQAPEFCRYDWQYAVGISTKKVLSSSGYQLFAMYHKTAGDTRTEYIALFHDGEFISLLSSYAHSIWLADLDGDGKYEVVSEVSVGSGICDDRITAVDADGMGYDLSARTDFDFRILNDSKEKSVNITVGMYSYIYSEQSNTTKQGTLRLINGELCLVDEVGAVFASTRMIAEERYNEWLSTLLPVRLLYDSEMNLWEKTPSHISFTGGLSQEAAFTAVNEYISKQDPDFFYFSNLQYAVGISTERAFLDSGYQAFAIYYKTGETVQIANLALFYNGNFVSFISIYSDKWLADIDYDGQYEVVSQEYMGSGIVDARISVVAADGMKSELSARMYRDFMIKNDPENASEVNITVAMCPAIGGPPTDISDRDIIREGTLRSIDGELCLVDEVGVVFASTELLLAERMESMK